jgi:hypothetical protein
MYFTSPQPAFWDTTTFPTPDNIKPFFSMLSMFLQPREVIELRVIESTQRH